jgi:DNA-directed RNA polymerase III subunit RPC6
MAHDERILYQLIESSTTSGMWTKTLKLKSNLHQSVVTRCLKSLEGKSLIKEIRSVKTPKRKIYMLTHYEPSEDVSGGPWHADGELDLELIETLTHFILEFVRAQSWAEMNHAQYATWKAQKKAAVAASQPPERPPLGPHRRPLIPKAPEATYPTAAQILSHVMDTGIVEGVVLRESDFRALLDMMEWDGLLERMGGTGYRTTRSGMVAEAADGAGQGNGLSDAPCGTCPVFNLCEDGGPVNAGNCVYFEEWLKL